MGCSMFFPKLFLSLFDLYDKSQKFVLCALNVVELLDDNVVFAIVDCVRSGCIEGCERIERHRSRNGSTNVVDEGGSRGRTFGVNSLKFRFLTVLGLALPEQSTGNASSEHSEEQEEVHFFCLLSGLGAEELVEADGIDGDTFETDFAELLVFVVGEGFVGKRS